MDNTCNILEKLQKSNHESMKTLIEYKSNDG